MMVKSILRLLRPKHYLKNVPILAPLVFGHQLLNSSRYVSVIVAFVTFSLTASVVYIVNDICDVEKDRLHPRKKFRPLVTGEVSIRQAGMLAVLLTVVIAVVGWLGHINLLAWLLLVAYVVINIAYSFGLKNVPILDVALLASGFVIRILFGASVFHIVVSHWLYMTVLAGAFYLGLGKRRNEVITTGTKSRKVNEYYSLQFLDKNMYVCLTLALVFYALWATEPERASKLMYATIPFVILLFMTYSLKVEESTSSGDPVDVIIKSKALRVFVPFVAILIVAAVYIK